MRVFEERKVHQDVLRALTQESSRKRKPFWFKSHSRSTSVLKQCDFERLSFLVLVSFLWFVCVAFAALVSPFAQPQRSFVPFVAFNTTRSDARRMVTQKLLARSLASQQWWCPRCSSGIAYTSELCSRCGPDWDHNPSRAMASFTRTSTSDGKEVPGTLNRGGGTCARKPDNLIFNSREAGRNCADKTRRRHAIKASFRKHWQVALRRREGSFRWI